MNKSELIEQYRPMLHSIALKLLKCRADAEDMVQETYMKWLSIDHEKIQNTKAYLIGTVTNTCINHLTSLRKRKTDFIDNFHWPEWKGLSKEEDFSHLDADAELSAAFAHLVTKLDPVERAVFLLKETFNVDYETLQKEFGKKQENCRQMLCRARKKLNSEAEKLSKTASAKKHELMSSFRKASHLDDFGSLMAILKKDMHLVPA